MSKNARLIWIAIALFILACIIVPGPGGEKKDAEQYAARRAAAVKNEK